MSFFIVSALVVLSDQLSKWLVMRNMAPYQSINLIGDFLSLTYVKNSGAAFGILEGKTWIFILATMAFIVIAVYCYPRIPKEMVIAKVGIALSLGGAVGNLIDRMRFNGVIDFIDVKYFSIFNLADCAICVGVFLLAWAILFRQEKKEENF